MKKNVVVTVSIKVNVANIIYALAVFTFILL